MGFSFPQNGLNALHLASKEGHVEVVAELLKLGATVDAATKVTKLTTLSLIAAHLMVMEIYIWIQHKSWLQYTVAVMCSYSMRTVSVQPFSGFTIGSIFNESCGEHHWKQ